MTADIRLPAGFESLTPFVARWARDTMQERLQVRCEASMEDIRAFYDAMLPLADGAIACIDAAGFDDLAADKATLAKLVLALAQAAIAIEMHGQPRAPGTPYPNEMRIVRGAMPLG